MHKMSEFTARAGSGLIDRPSCCVLPVVRPPAVSELGHGTCPRLIVPAFRSCPSREEIVAWRPLH